MPVFRCIVVGTRSLTVALLEICRRAQLDGMQQRHCSAPCVAFAPPRQPTNREPFHDSLRNRTRNIEV